MSQIHSRTVSPLSLMIDVFVQLERLQHNLETLRDELVVHPEQRCHVELFDARRCCRKIDEELRSISSLLQLQAEPQEEVPAPKGPPNLKVVP
jgi:alkyl hydroperoxide reductase subunit AhpC